MPDIRRHHVFEAELSASQEHAQPFQQVEVRVQLTGPSGRTRTIDAFWDGGQSWRFRFSPDEAGVWQWQSRCEQDAGLAGEGTFTCVVSDDDRPLFRHGPVRLSEDRRRFVHADGTPFFWLADTAWNGPLKARPSDWQRYLDRRCEQGFTAIQFVGTQWRAYSAELAYAGEQDVAIRPAFYQRLDKAVQRIHDAGLLAVPVMLWAHVDSDPGVALPEADAIRVARYMLARWDAFHAAWLLAGDLKPGPGRNERWQRIGRAVFRDDHEPIATLHPCGQTSFNPVFASEPWHSFRSYQTSHGDQPGDLRWAVTGAPATEWRDEPPLPSINLEPNYEAAKAYRSDHVHTDYDVRRAVYWSLLTAPTAGVTYGHNGVWPWNEQAGPAEGHGSWHSPPWHEGIDTPGIASMTVLRQLFDTLPWPAFMPAQDLLPEQDAADPTRYIVAAATPDRRTALLYTRVGGPIQLNPITGTSPTAAIWINPRTGARHDTDPIPPDQPATVQTPDDQDWLLLLKR